MDNHIEQLVKIANNADSAGNAKLAYKIDALSDSLLNIKVAQYVGSQGYWIRNSRCWANCYKRKRGENPSMPAQEVWGECHKEYLEAINNDNSKWDKYADSEEGQIKLASTRKYLDDKLANSIERHTKEGMSLGHAIFASIDDMQHETYEDMVKVATNLFNLASEFVDDRPSDSIKIAEVAEDITKEAQGFFSGLGGALRDSFEGFRQSKNINKYISQMDNSVKSIMQAIKELNGARTDLMNYLQNNPGRTPAQKQRSYQTMNALQEIMPKHVGQISEKWQNIRKSIDQHLGQQVSQSPQDQQPEGEENGNLVNEQKTPNQTFTEQGGQQQQTVPGVNPTGRPNPYEVGPPAGREPKNRARQFEPRANNYKNDKIKKGKSIFNLKHNRSKV